jgi:hypothetical protein
MLAPLLSMQVDAYYNNGNKQITVAIQAARTSGVTCYKLHKILLQTKASYMIFPHNKYNFYINPLKHSGDYACRFL